MEKESIGITIPYLVGLYSVENGSTRQRLKVTGHSAVIGDVVKLTSAGHVNREASVISVEANFINLNKLFPLAPKAGDTFAVLRFSYLTLPISVTNTDGYGAMVTLTSSRVTIGSGSSSVLLSANASRKYGGWIQNHSGQNVWCNVGAPAVVSEGFLIDGSNHGVYYINTKQEIQGIQSSGGNITLDIFEAT